VFTFVLLQALRLMEPRQAMKELGLPEHEIRFTSTLTLEDDGQPTKTADKIYQLIKRYVHRYVLHEYGARIGVV